MDVEITSLNEGLHEIFQQILDETIGGIPPQDQVRFVLHSNQLEYSINFPFMAPGRLTTEHILAEFGCIIQSNKECDSREHANGGQRHQTLGSEFGETFGKEEIYHKNTKRG